MRPFPITSFFSSMARLFASAPEPSYATVEIYERLRAQALALRPEQVGATKDDPVIAVLMETGHPGLVATLVSVIDGGSSIYLSSGGGITGSGEHEQPNAASKKLVRSAASFLTSMDRAEQSPLPQKGFTRFYVVTPSGLFTTEVKEEDLGEGRHALSALFYTAHELITEIRLIDELR